MKYVIKNFKDALGWLKNPTLKKAVAKTIGEQKSLKNE